MNPLTILAAAFPVVHVTEHAYDRVKQRLGLKGKNARRRVEQAWHRGVIGHDLPPESELGIWLARKQRKNSNVTSIRVLNGFAFVFADMTCLTVLDVKVRPVKAGRREGRSE